MIPLIVVPIFLAIVGAENYTPKIPPLTTQEQKAFDATEISIIDAMNAQIDESQKHAPLCIDFCDQNGNPTGGK